MASFIITSIYSALRDLPLLQDKCPDNLLMCKFAFLRQRLRNLLTFLLCIRKLGNDVHLRSDDSNNEDGSVGSLIARIKDAVCRHAQKIHTYRLSLEDGFSMDVGNEVDNFQLDIESFEKEIDEWYITLSYYSLEPSSPVNIVEKTDSVLDNIEEFLIMHMHEELLVQHLETLREKIKFLRSFISFATMLTVDHKKLEDLLAHTEAIAVDSAHLIAQYTLTVSHIFNMASDEKWWEGMPQKILELRQKISPIDPRVYEIYTQALSGLKLSRQLHAPTLDSKDDPPNIMKDFIDFLLCDFWGILQLDTSMMASVKDPRQVLYEELRVLRTILKEQPNKFNEKTMDLARVVICDAGVIIFSLYQKDVTIDLHLFDLLGRMKVLRAEVEGRAPETSTFAFSKTNELGFVDSLLENLMELASCEAYSNAQSQIQIIHDELVFLRSFLWETVELRNAQQELRTVWDCVMEVVCRVEFFIDQLVLGDKGDFFSTSFDSITEDISNVKTDVSKFFNSNRKDFKIKKFTQSTQAPSHYIVPITDEFVGFHDEATSIIDRLARGSKKLQIVAIVGMAGLGKTTLATKVYNDNLVMRHFHVRARSTVSQVLNKKKVLLELLNHIVPDKSFQMDEQDLVEELWRGLKGRRYLIFLDDVWDVEAWNSLGLSFPDDSYGSRIILTSRHSNVAPPAMLDADPHFLRQLTIDESLELLQRKLFPGTGWPPAIYELGMQIAENCKGLPLTIVIIAGLLATMKQEDWKEVLKNFSSGIISSLEQFKNSLELSYKHLPDYLKPCFLYFAAFPEDQEVSVKKLIWLWISEGFVRKTDLKSLDDGATNYMMDLIGRSLVMVAQRRSIGGVKTCRIHDLLHDFCLTKAKEENFLQLLQGYDALLSFNEPCNLRRLCIYSKQEHFKESKVFCPRLRSLPFFDEPDGLSDQRDWYERSSFDISFIIQSFKLLRVLHVRQINLGPVFPSEMELLVQLRYLALQAKVEVIPSSISNLSNLETFTLDPIARKVSLPHTLFSLQKLRHLHIKASYARFAGFSLPTENLDNSPNLHALDSFSGAIISSQQRMENQMRKFPNIRKLKCKVFEYEDDDTENSNEIMVPEFLSRLEFLNVSPFDLFRSHIHEYEFTFPAKLKKLTLSLFGLPWSKISTIGNLPNLEVLKLLEGSFSGETWEMEEGEFPKLRFLKLASLDIVRWTASDDQLPNLQKLVLKSCYYLEEIPSCLENICTLEMIEVSSYSERISNLVQHIQDVQMDMGNSSLKIIIPHALHETDFVRSDNDD